MSTNNISVKDLSFKEILKAIIGLFKIPDTPSPPIPPPLIYKSSSNPGLSPRKIASNIIARQSEAGAPFGPMPSGADNVEEKMEQIRVEEIIKGIMESRITVVVPPGILVNGTAISPVGPLPVVGATVTPFHVAYGVIQ
jgi:hypothetical protein